MPEQPEQPKEIVIRIIKDESGVPGLSVTPQMSPMDLADLLIGVTGTIVTNGYIYVAALLGREKGTQSLFRVVDSGEMPVATVAETLRQMANKLEGQESGELPT